jgi:hypothetical protein
MGKPVPLPSQNDTIRSSGTMLFVEAHLSEFNQPSAIINSMAGIALTGINRLYVTCLMELPDLHDPYQLPHSRFILFFNQAQIRSIDDLC